MQSKNEQESQIEKISDPSQIAHLLKKLREERAIFTAKIPKKEGQYTTAIIDVDAQHQWIKLDELAPNAGHEQFLQHKKLHLYTKHRGVEIHLALQLQSVSRDKNIAYYLVNFPEVLDYHQRRDHFRVQVPRTAGLRLAVYNTDKKECKGEVKDLSTGGLGARMEGHLDAQLGDRFPRCRLLLPENAPLILDLVVCFIRFQESSRQTQLGAQFEKISSADHKLLTRIIAGLQRDLIRKQR